MRLGFALWTLSLVACGDGRSIIDVDLDADPCIAELAARLEVRVLDGEGALVEAFDVEPVFPSGVRLTADEGGAAWRVEATLFDENDIPLGDVAASGTFDNGTLDSGTFLRRFEDSCLGILCGEGESCSNGFCAADEGFASLPTAPRPESCQAWLFVSTDGSDDAGCGDFGSPCASLAHLAEEGGRLSAGGGVVNVAGGTYGGNTRLRPDYGGPIVVRAWPGMGEPIFDAQGADVALSVQGSDVTLQDLSARGAQDHGIAVNLTMVVRQERVRIRRCTLSGNGTNTLPLFPEYKAGMQFNNNVNDFVVEDSVFEDNVGPEGWVVSGLYVNKASDGLIRRNRFVNNRTGGLTVTESTGLEIRDNVFASNGVYGAWLSQDVGSRIEGNRFCGHPEAGVLSDSEIPTVVVSNTFAQNGIGIQRSSPNGGTLSYDRNVFLSQSGAAVDFRSPSFLAPVDGVNLYFDNGSETAGFERSAPGDDIAGDPMLSGLADCSLTRAADDPYPDFGAP